MQPCSEMTILGPRMSVSACDAIVFCAQTVKLDFLFHLINQALLPFNATNN